MSSSIRPTTIALATIGALATGFVGETTSPAYAVYFDHKRRTDPGFRKSLKRESRRIAKAAKQEAEAQGAQQKQAVRDAVTEAQEEGFPATVEEKETFFMNMVGQGEALCQSESTHIEAALCFYKALKVYPQPGDLITIYDKTVPKPVLDMLAEMVAFDGTMPIGNFGGGSGSDAGGSTGAVDD
ncbi:MAG: hypothetical protein LQ343_003848 [Gyalolechia ehrenbergii]|nr:MAG: hypothetical protein LQ343_003848 [Gyalolechia ehrenbergii]